MAKGKHAEFTRHIIDDQVYVLMYADGRIKVVLKEGTLEVTEVLTRNGESTPGSHVFMRAKRGTHPKPLPHETRRGRAHARQVAVARREQP